MIDVLPLGVSPTGSGHRTRNTYEVVRMACSHVVGRITYSARCEEVGSIFLLSKP